MILKSQHLDWIVPLLEAVEGAGSDGLPASALKKDFLAPQRSLAVSRGLIQRMAGDTYVLSMTGSAILAEDRLDLYTAWLEDPRIDTSELKVKWRGDRRKRWPWEEDPDSYVIEKLWPTEVSGFEEERSRSQGGQDKSADFCPTDYQILKLFVESRTGIRLKTGEIARQIGMTAKSIGKNLSDLKERGYLENPGRRGYAITKTGRAAYA